MGPTSSLGIIAGERIPYEASPTSIPQRHVAGENPDVSPGKRAIVVPLLCPNSTLVDSKGHQKRNKRSSIRGKKADTVVQELSPSLARRSEAESLTLMREAPTIVTERVTLFPSSLVRRAEHCEKKDANRLSKEIEESVRVQLMNIKVKNSAQVAEEWEIHMKVQVWRSMRYKKRDTLVAVILEVICIKDLVALHFGETFVMD
ncbi:hypothetical protein Tco_0656826 [Tanacetum coccineum]|uniref:Uncharacterized protein n=1 Tax=Tanacetum coccineum TaxID=301880 RepID=A0ABQ4X9U8_9ASTR